MFSLYFQWSLVRLLLGWDEHTDIKKMFVEMSPQLSEKFSVALVDDAVIRQYTDALDRVSGRVT